MLLLRIELRGFPKRYGFYFRLLFLNVFILHGKIHILFLFRQADCLFVLENRYNRINSSNIDNRDCFRSEARNFFKKQAVLLPLRNRFCRIRRFPHLSKSAEALFDRLPVLFFDTFRKLFIKFEAFIQTVKVFFIFTISLKVYERSCSMHRLFSLAEGVKHLNEPRENALIIRIQFVEFLKMGFRLAELPVFKIQFPQQEFGLEQAGVCGNKLPAHLNGFFEFIYFPVKIDKLKKYILIPRFEFPRLLEVLLRLFVFSCFCIEGAHCRIGFAVVFISF